MTLEEVAKLVGGAAIFRTDVVMYASEDIIGLDEKCQAGEGVIAGTTMTEPPLVWKVRTLGADTVPRGALLTAPDLQGRQIGNSFKLEQPRRSV
jgi:hypothetical protein